MKGTLRLEDVVACLDRDLVLYIEVAEPNQPRLLYEVNLSIKRFRATPESNQINMNRNLQAEAQRWC